MFLDLSTVLEEIVDSALREVLEEACLCQENRTACSDLKLSKMQDTL